MNVIDQQNLRTPQMAGTLNSTEFFGDVVAKLAETLEDTVGLEDAQGYIATVGESLGGEISALYDIGKPSNKYDIANVLVDMKHQIGGNFSVVSTTGDQIVLTNNRCPFLDRVHGNKSLCMMTTNVFGRIAADRAGYSHVVVEDSIAENRKHCRVVVTLKPESVKSDSGIEFFGA